MKQTPHAVLTDPINSFKFCSGGLASLTVYDASTPSVNSQYVINWGDGTPNYSSTIAPSGVLHTYASGVFRLIYTVTGPNGCTDVFTKTVYNITNPQIGAANPGNTQGCGPKTICFPINTFSGNDSSTTYRVDFGDGSPVQIFNHPPPDTICHNYVSTSCGKPGNSFTFTIIAGNGCDTSKATISPVKVFTQPVADFTSNPNPACVNTSVRFTNVTIVGANNTCDSTATYTWNFGDGSPNVTVFTKTPQIHTYTAPGTYTITLSAQNFCGISTATHTVCIVDRPNLQFSINPTIGCAPFGVSPNNTSTIPAGCVTMSPIWTISKTSFICGADSVSDYSYQGGTTSQSFSPNLQFNNQGTYSITLAVTNNVCNVAFVTSTITVKTKPVPSLTGNTVCLGANDVLTAGGVACGGTLSGYSWTIPNGNPSTATGLTVTTQFTSSGLQSVSLSETNECGTASTFATVNVSPLPTANAGPDKAYCTGSSTTIGSSAISGQTYSWTPTSSLSSSTSASPTVTLSTPGIYSYILTVKNTATGCTAKDTVLVTVNPKPIISIMPNNQYICRGSGITLLASGADTYSWSPTGSLSLSLSGDTANAHPVANTTYSVTGTVTSTGCSNTATVTVNVRPLPTVTAPASMQVCNQPIAVQISPAATPAGGTWSGPNISASGIFTPSGIGSFVETYTYTDANGCTNSSTTTVQVVSALSASAGPDDTVCQNSAAIHLSGSPSGGTWSGSFVTTAGIFTQSTVGTYPLIYKYGSGSCLTSDTMLMYVNTGPTLQISPSPSTICKNDSVLLLASGANTYAWSSAATLSLSISGDSARAHPTATTAYTVTGTIQATGCSASISTTVSVTPLPIVSTVRNVQLCDQPVPYSLTGTPAGGTWSGPNVTTSGIFTPNGTGTFMAIYRYTASTGCSDTASTVIQVTSASAANAGRDSTVCQGSPSIQLAGTPSGGTWSGSSVNASGLATTSTPGTFYLAYSTAGNATCSTRDTMILTVNPIPSVTVTPTSSTLCNGQSVKLQAAGADLYSWSPSSTLSISLTGDTANAHPSSTTAYLVTGTYQATGCKGSASVQVNVNQRPAITNASLAQSICSGASSAQVNLTSTVAGTTYAWTAVSAGVTGFQPSGTSLIPSQTLTNADTVTHLVTYAIVPTANGCVGDTAFYVIAVKPIPSIAPMPFQALCSGSNSTVVHFHSSVAGTAYSWTATAPAGVTGYNVSGTTDSLPSFMLLNTNATNQILTFTIIPSAAGCPGPLSTYADTIIPTPNTSFSLPVQTVCNDSSSRLVILSSTTPNVTFVWTAVQPSGITGVATSGNGTIPVQHLTNGTNQAVQIVYYAHAITDDLSCPGPVATYTISVEPKPAVSATVQRDTLCSGIQANISLSSNLASTNYSWTVSAPPSLSGASAGTGSMISQTITNNSPSPAQVTYTITPSANGCVGDPISVTLTINPAPLVHFDLDSQIICSGTSTRQVTVISTTASVSYAWTSVSQPGITGVSASGLNAIPVQTITNATNNPVTILYLAHATYNGCQGQDSAYKITVNPTPHVTTPLTSQTICSDDSMVAITFASDVLGTTFTWQALPNASLTGFSASGSGSVIPAQGIHSTVSVIDTLYYQVTPFYQGCPGPSVLFPIIVRPKPVISLSPDTQRICSKNSDQTIRISSSVAGTSFAWAGTASNVTSSSLSGTSDTIPYHYFENTSPRGDTGFIAYQVTSFANGCAGNPVTAAVFVDPIPIANFGVSPYSGCSPLTAQFAPNAVTYGSPDSLTFSWGDGTPNLTVYPSPAQPRWPVTSHSFVNHSNVSSQTFTVTMTAHNRCGDSSSSQQITVLPNSVNAFFSADKLTGCTPLTVKFRDYSTGGNYTNWCLNFNPTRDSCMGASLILPSGDSTQQTYTTAGTYIVALYVTDGCSRDTAYKNIVVTESPRANFTDSSSICQGHAVIFRDQSVGTSLFNGFSWTFGDNATSSATNPMHGYANSGIFQVCHGVTTVDGCKDSLCRNITVNPSPVVTSNAKADTICSGNRTNILLSSTAAGASFSWTAVAPSAVTGAAAGVGNAIRQTLNNGDINPKTVYYIITPTANGCSGAPDTVSVTVNPSPQAFFSPSPQSVCSGQHSQTMLLTSSSGGVNLQWTAVQPFGITGVIASGTDSVPVQTLINGTQSPITITYTGTATLTDSRHCAGPPVTASITVNPIPSITSPMTTQSICSNTSSQPIILASSVSGTTYAWGTVVSTPISGNTPASGIGNIPSFLLNNNSPTPGFVVITVTPSYNSCVGSPKDDSIIIKPIPVASISQAPQAVCTGTSTTPVVINSTVSATTYSWSATASSGVTGYAAAGNANPIPAQTLSNSTLADQLVTYTTTPTAAGCAGLPISYVDTVKPSPATAFSRSDQTLCSGATSAFVSLTSATPGVSFSWTASQPAGITGATSGGTDFIPAQQLHNSTSNPLTVTYTASATTSGRACPGASSTYSITVNPVPNVAPVPNDTICSGTSTSIHLSSTTPGTVLSWSVQSQGAIAGASSGVGSTIAQTLTNGTPTPQQVTYRIRTNLGGCVGDSATATAIVNPVATVNPVPAQSICSGQSSQPAILTSPTAGVAYQWTANANGAGGVTPSGSGNIPSQTLTNSLTAPIRVIYSVQTIYNGCVGVPSQDTVIVNPIPVISITPSQVVCEGTPTAAVALNSNIATNPVSYSWHMSSSGGVTGYPVGGTTLIIPSFTPNSPNDTTTAVTFSIVASSLGCAGPAFTYAVYVKPSPVALAVVEADTICSGSTIRIALRSDVVGSGFSWTANAPSSISGASNGVGDTIRQTLFNSASQLQSLTYTVTPSFQSCFGQPIDVTAYVQPSPNVLLPGTQTVCSKQLTTPVTISSSAPGAVFAWTATGNNTIGFVQSGTGNIPAQAITDTSHTMDGQVVFHIIPTAGSCPGTGADYIVDVNHAPLSKFSADNVCVNTQPASIANLSIGGSYYAWSFGDGNSSVANAPSHTYSTDGTFTITLIASSQAGCSDTSIRQEVIYPKPHAIFALPSTDYCNAPQTVAMQNLSTGAVGYQWLLGNGNSSAATNPSTTYNTVGSYGVQLIATSSFLCRDTSMQSITLHNQPVISSLELSPHRGCQALTVSLSVQQQNSIYYRWDFGDGSSVLDSSGSSISHLYTDTGTYSIRLHAYAYESCADSILLQDTVTVLLRPMAAFTYTTEDTIIGAGTPVTFINESVNASTYAWEFGSGQASTDVSPVYRYPDFEHFTITLVATAQNGCADTAYRQIEILGGKLYVPNAFAPEYVGGSDMVREWKPSGFGLSSYRAQIFNTYGELLWESNRLVNTEPADGWDGTYKGSIVQQDVYVWKIDAVFQNGARWNGMSYQGKAPRTMGDVTVIR